jgi:hypothetical protein
MRQIIASIIVSYAVPELCLTYIGRAACSSAVDNMPATRRERCHLGIIKAVPSHRKAKEVGRTSHGNIVEFEPPAYSQDAIL